ncbi:MAG: S1/P1 nuclease, partial [Planctomycetes bacterium]|nr:S1/P1 nuclease [Planctomycetota bacterium]
MTPRTLCVLLLLASLLRPAPAAAWGPEGHEVIGALAEKLLDEEAKKALHELLAKDQQLSDFDICVWADTVRKELKNGTWHYVDIPFEADNYDPKRDGKDGVDVIERIAFFAKVLKDKKETKANRLNALKYLVHFVGDMHQPLHCIERDHDQGGNKVAVTMPGKTEASNLHRVWDGDFVMLNLEKTLPATYGENLYKEKVAKMDAEERKKIESGTAADWALECHAVAKKDVYQGVKNGDTLTEAYVANARKVSDQQMLKAGMRL